MIYTDDAVDIALPEVPAARGHIHITSKASPERFFLAASYASTALFELLKSQGTNVIATINDSGATADVIARFENDDLNFMWQPTQGNPDEIKSVAKKLRDDMEIQDHKARKPKEEPEPQEPKKLSVNPDKTNYLIDSLKRHP